MGMTPTIDVLLDARALLARTDGWIQEGRRRMVNGQFAYCIEGALAAADPKSQLFSDAWARVQGLLDEPIPRYNDAPERQQSEVVETIDRAIRAEWRGDLIPRVQPIEIRTGVLDVLKPAWYVPPPNGG